MANRAPTTTTNDALLPRIEGRIQLLPGLRVMIDADLSSLYGMPTKALNQAVKRNAGRFPTDFMFQLVRAFVRLRQAASVHADLAKRLMELEEKTERLELSHDTFSRNTRVQLKQVFDAIRELMTPPEPPKRPIGFVTPEDMGKKTSAAKRKA